MTKDAINQYDNVAANNTDVGGIDTSATMAPSDVNDAVREIMSHLADVDDGTSSLTSPDINGGTIDGTVIGGTTPAAISGTTGTFSGNLTVDTNTLFVDAATNNIGIGTSSPDSGTPLHVQESSASLGANPTSSALLVERAGSVAMTLGTSNTGSASIFFGDPENLTGGRVTYDNSNNALQFWANASERLRLTSDGRLGLGVSAPDTKLHVEGDQPVFRLTSTNALSTAGGTETIADIQWEAQQNNLYRVPAFIRARQDGTWSTVTAPLAPAAIEFYTQDGTASDTTTSPRMVIDSNGRLGIGVASPTTPLAVAGKGTFSGAGSFEALELITSDANRVYVTGNSSVNGDMWRLGTSASNPYLNIDALQTNGEILFRTGGTNERMRITSDGRLGVNTSSPIATLDVNGTQIALSNAGTDTRHIEIGVGRTGNGFSFIDLIGDTTYPDYGLRLIRGNTGPNTSSELTHRGTGPLVITAFDAGYIDLRTANTNRLRITGTGLVGINNSTPTRHLSVNGSIQFASGGVIEAGTSSLNTYIAGVEGASGRWAFATNGSERMRLTSDGRLGLNTSSPATVLHTKAGSNLETDWIFTAQNNAGTAVTEIGGYGYNHNLYHKFWINDFEKMRLTSDGRLGLGTSSPAVSLQINSSGSSYTNPDNNNLPTIYLNNTNNASTTAHSILLLRTAGSAGGDPFISYDISGEYGWSAGVDNSDGNKYKIAASWSSLTSNTRLTIDSSGRVGIGVSPSYKLHVSGDIYATGNVTAYSSAVAKDDIATIPDALDLVEQLRGVSFKWRDSGKKAVGLIYEEVKEVIPELTSNEGDNPGVAYQNTVALLIEAVKSLSARVKELEAK